MATPALVNQGSGLHYVAAAPSRSLGFALIAGSVPFHPLLFSLGTSYAAVRCSSRGWAMITSRGCRERAAECRQMAERAPNATVQAILIDMARTWERLAIQAAHSRTIVAADQMAFPFTAVQ